uniref:Small ribosomal subunit protein uS3c n=1 Tax=Mallomonas splendens TaxID=52552 RepID=A0A3G2QZM5_9STRA|nr:ribosomal protein S3 [Mallomonas splendens]AYO28577.1 ribosomal protein S3 [Mallomonas splendens]
MGQKTHPKGFRLVTTEKHLSNWYGTKFYYSDLIKEDYYIRKKTQEFFNEFLSISKVEINRVNQGSNQKEYVNIQIKALFPRAKEMSRKVTKYFSETTENPKVLTLLNTAKGNLKNFTTLLLKRTIRNFTRFLQVKTGKNYYIKIDFIKNPFEDATLIAKFISEQLEKRTPFRRAVKQTIKKVQRTSMKGIKIQLSGRLNGIDIARSEWKREGRVPLHTLKAKIDYSHESAQTIYGVIGIKVWLFAGE